MSKEIISETDVVLCFLHEKLLACHFALASRTTVLRAWRRARASYD